MLEPFRVNPSKQLRYLHNQFCGSILYGSITSIPVTSLYFDIYGNISIRFELDIREGHLHMERHIVYPRIIYHREVYTRLKVMRLSQRYNSFISVETQWLWPIFRVSR